MYCVIVSLDVCAHLAEKKLKLQNTIRPPVSHPPMAGMIHS